jgi:hypothetical protein
LQTQPTPPQRIVLHKLRLASPVLQGKSQHQRKRRLLLHHPRRRLLQHHLLPQHLPQQLLIRPQRHSLQQLPQQLSPHLLLITGKDAIKLRTSSLIQIAITAGVHVMICSDFSSMAITMIGLTGRTAITRHAVHAFLVQKDAASWLMKIFLESAQLSATEHHTLIKHVAVATHTACW